MSRGYNGAYPRFQFLITKSINDWNVFGIVIKEDIVMSFWSEWFDFLKLRDLLVLIIITSVFMFLDIFGFKIGKEAYFYTLSTISQTLAALIGIIAIFIIFKLEMLKNERNNSVLRLKNLFSSDLMKCGGSYCTKEPYKNLFITIGKYYDDSTIDGQILNKLSSNLAEINSNYPHQPQMKEIIKILTDSIYDIDKIDDHIKNIPIKFKYPASFGFAAIMLSIFVLPFGGITVPADLSLNLLNLPSSKSVVVGFIVSLTILSIFQMPRFIEYVFGLNSKSTKAVDS